MGNSIRKERVLVTGGTGFLGIHCILQLLEKGFIVKTTVRRPEGKKDILAMLRTGGLEEPENLDFFIADLGSDEGWEEAVSGCDYVLHVASPFPTVMPRDENELILPAREGTLRVLRLARQGGIRRVVITSSFAAIGYGQDKTDRTFTESDWTNPEVPGISAYVKSKTLAEKAAWDFMAENGNNPELAVVNPVAILGPVLGPKLSSSIQIVKQLLEGRVTAAPKIYFSVVDVRDVADLLIRAMTHTEASGQRFLAVTGPSLSLIEVAGILRKNMGEAAKKAPTRELPNWIVRLSAPFMPQVRAFIPELGKPKNASNDKSRSLLGWKPGTREDAILSSAESLIHLNLLAT